MRSQNIDLAIVSDPYTRGATVPDIPHRWYRFHHDQTPRCLIISPNPSFDIFPLHVSPYIIALTLNAPCLSILFFGVYAAPSVALDHILTVLSDILSSHTFANVVMQATLMPGTPCGVVKSPTQEDVSWHSSATLIN